VFVWKSGAASHVNTFELGQYGRSRSNVWDYAGVNSLKPGRLEDLAMHSTVKPVALGGGCAIKDCSRRNDLVLDPFAGSGTIAAERTGRRARALEIDPSYVDVAVRRWEAYTRRTATLAGTCSTFEKISDERNSNSTGGCGVPGGANDGHAGRAIIRQRTS
jgi:DNA modification methylase